MIALPPPYGLGQKSVHISMRIPNDHYEDAEIIAIALGCPPPVAAKVALCIRYSGRYDCLVNDEVPLDKLRRRLEKLGGSLETVDFSFDEGLYERTREAWLDGSQTVEYMRSTSWIEMMLIRMIAEEELKRRRVA